MKKKTKCEYCGAKVKNPCLNQRRIWRCAYYVYDFINRFRIW